MMAVGRNKKNDVSGVCPCRAADASRQFDLQLSRPPLESIMARGKKAPPGDYSSSEEEDHAHSSSGGEDLIEDEEEDDRSMAGKMC